MADELPLGAAEPHTREGVTGMLPVQFILVGSGVVGVIRTKRVTVRA